MSENENAKQIRAMPGQLEPCVMAIDSILDDFGNAIIQNLHIDGVKILVGSNISLNGKVISTDYARRIKSIFIP